MHTCFGFARAHQNSVMSYLLRVATKGMDPDALELAGTKQRNEEHICCVFLVIGKSLGRESAIEVEFI
jgi:hypothetical protein